MAPPAPRDRSSADRHTDRPIQPARRRAAADQARSGEIRRDRARSDSHFAFGGGAADDLDGRGAATRLLGEKLVLGHQLAELGLELRVTVSVIVNVTVSMAVSVTVGVTVSATFNATGSVTVIVTIQLRATAATWEASHRFDV